MVVVFVLARFDNNQDIDPRQLEVASRGVAHIGSQSKNATLNLNRLNTSSSVWILRCTSLNVIKPCCALP